VGIYSGRYTDDLHIWTADAVGIGDCMYAIDFWRVEDNNNSTTHRQQMLQKVHM
jgi:hypothetical protein